MTNRELENYEKSHAKYIQEIQSLDERMDHLAPYEIAKLEYLYSKAERQAWVIAAYHKKKQKYFEGMAEIKQGQEYQKARIVGKSGTDAQYLSRITKGEMLCAASAHEGDYVSWRGIAQTSIRRRAIQERFGPDAFIGLDFDQVVKDYEPVNIEISIEKFEYAKNL